MNHQYSAMLNLLSALDASGRHGIARRFSLIMKAMATMATAATTGLHY
jgi:hypothetical protein